MTNAQLVEPFVNMVSQKHAFWSDSADYWRVGTVRYTGATLRSRNMIVGEMKADQGHRPSQQTFREALRSILSYPLSAVWVWGPKHAMVLFEFCADGSLTGREPADEARFIQTFEPARGLTA
jgi:hypothetical protein